MRALSLAASSLLWVLAASGCGAPTVGLKTGVYTFEGVRGRSATPSSALTASSVEIDVLTREVKATVGGATRRFNLSQMSTLTSGCPGNFGAMPQDTRTLDAPNLQFGEFLIDEPLLRAECPAGSGVIVLQQGPLSSSGAPACSEEIICLAFRTR